MKFWQKKQPIKLIEVKIAHGFTAYGDDFVFEYFWNLYSYSDGSRKVVAYQCGAMEKTKTMDLSAKPRVDAWENGFNVLNDGLIIEFDKLEKGVGLFTEKFIKDFNKRGRK